MTRRKVSSERRKSAPAFERAHVELSIVKLIHGMLTLLPAVLLVCATPAQAQSATAAPDNAPIDVNQLFATTCALCHSDGGRAAGKVPQLMDTKRDDEFLRDRIKNGKSGAMPAFSSTFSDAQIDQIIKYIRELKPREG